MIEPSAASSAQSRRVRLEHDERRERILGAARTLFAHRPYDSVSTTQVAAAAGTTRTNVHYYFGTKRSLFLEVVTRFSDLRLSHVPTGADVSPRQAIESTFTAWLDLVEQNAEMYLVLVQTPTTASDVDLSEVLEHSLNAWETRLLKLVGASNTDRRARSMVRAFQGMVRAGCDEWLRQGELSKSDVLTLLTEGLLAIRDGLS